MISIKNDIIDIFPNNLNVVSTYMDIFPPTQASEEELFGNHHHSEAMEEFLQVLGDRVKLKDFKG